MAVNDYILKIVQAALSNAGSSDYPTSSLLKDAQRVANLRRDYVNLWWILQELQGSQKNGLKEIDCEMKGKFVYSEYESLGKDYLIKWINERLINEIDTNGRIINKDQVYPYCIYDIEERIQSIDMQFNSLINTKGMHTLDVYYLEQQNACNRAVLNLLREQYRNIDHRIRDRVTNYLVESEMQLIQGDSLSRYFENNKQWVEEKLASFDVAFVDYLNALNSHLSKGTDVDNEEALLDIRKILWCYANYICPPSEEAILCSDGKKRVLSDDKYLNRISYALFERGGLHTHTEILNQNIEDLVKRVEKINELACKGVHGKVSEMETNQCVIQMYIVLGDLIRTVDS